MIPNPRRRFIIQLAAASTTAAASRAFAQPARVEEDNEQAVALGYKHDTTQVDTKKYPQHSNSQRCSNCSFFQGKPTDPWGGCAMFGRKHIAGPGWCLAWAKAPG